VTRTFVAVFPPEAIRLEIARRLAPLAGDSAVKWVAPELMHFTLRFFGDLDEGRIERVKELTEQVASLERPFGLRLGGAGTFPPKGRPRVYWVGVEAGARELVDLAEMLDRAYAGAQLGASDRPMTPHLTVGRARQMRGKRPREERNLPDFRRLTFDTPDFIVRSVCVVASRLSPRGPAYTPLAEFLLSGEG
jgi:2'-5' RNA ligase